MTMQPLVTMRAALEDDALFGRVLQGESWQAWRVLLIAAMGEELTADERAIFAKLTGRAREPGTRCEELWAIVGRRGGKTRSAAVLACFTAALCEHPLSIGERGLALFLAQNQRQAAIAFGYAAAIFDAVPMLRELVIGRTASTLSLSNGVDLEVRAASFRGLRGVTCVSVIADECGYWAVAEESANVDSEIFNAVRPSLATTSGPLISISTPYAKRGELYRMHREHYGPSGDPLLLVAQAASRDLNPALPQAVVDRAYQRDPVSAAAEYGGAFRSDIETFVPLEIVQGCVGDYREIGPLERHAYRAFCDPSGGSADSMCLAIAHSEGDLIVIDAIREVQPPFSPASVVNEFAALLRMYRVRVVVGDRYGGEFPRELFRQHSIEYRPADKPKSDLFRDLLPLLNSGRVRLPKSDKLVSQLVGLERRTARTTGRDLIDHAPGGHDDVANCVAGVADLVATPAPGSTAFIDNWDGDALRARNEARQRVANEQSPPCLIKFPTPVRPVTGNPSDGFGLATWT
jgi:hypothetical protein